MTEGIFEKLYKMVKLSSMSHYSNGRNSNKKVNCSLL